MVRWRRYPVLAGEGKSAWLSYPFHVRGPRSFSRALIGITDLNYSTQSGGAAEPQRRNSCAYGSWREEA
jgi:hypothetical protein